MWSKPVNVGISGLLLAMVFAGSLQAQSVQMPSPPSGSVPAPTYVQGADGMPVLNTNYNSSLNRPLQTAGTYRSAMDTAARTMRNAAKYRKKTGDVETACAMAQSAVRIVAGELSPESPVLADYQHKADEICKAVEKS